MEAMNRIRIIVKYLALLQAGYGQRDIRQCRILDIRRDRIPVPTGIWRNIQIANKMPHCKPDGPGFGTKPY
jgi:hypothetical protein